MFEENARLAQEFSLISGLDALLRVAMFGAALTQLYALKAVRAAICLVDGMNAVIKSNYVVHQIYSLTTSEMSKVSKSALEILLVIIDFDEKYLSVVVDAAIVTAKERGSERFQSLVKLIENPDEEVRVCAISLINRMIRAVDTEDGFYDLTDSFEIAGIAAIIASAIKTTTNSVFKSHLEAYEKALEEADNKINVIAPDLSEATQSSPGKFARKKSSPLLRIAAVDTPSTTDTATASASASASSASTSAAATTGTAKKSILKSSQDKAAATGSAEKALKFSDPTGPEAGGSKLKRAGTGKRRLGFQQVHVEEQDDSSGGEDENNNDKEATDDGSGSDNENENNASNENDDDNETGKGM